jgi:hypothetical protein
MLLGRYHMVLYEPGFIIIRSDTMSKLFHFDCKKVFSYEWKTKAQEDMNSK